MPSDLHPIRARKRIHSTLGFDRFKTDLTEAANKAMPSNRDPYSKKAILTFHWSNTDIDVQQPLTRLHNCLRDKYDFICETYEIDATCDIRQCGHKLVMAIREFVNKYGSLSDYGSLLCFNYSGHGFQARDGTLTIFGKLDTMGYPEGPSLSWPEIEADMKPSGYSTDTSLIILDCCDAAAAAVTVSDRVEMLGAAGWCEAASADVKTAFSTILADHLDSSYNKQERITACRLTSRIMSRAMKAQLKWGTPFHCASRDSDKSPVTFTPKTDPKPPVRSGAPPSASPSTSFVTIKAIFEDGSELPSLEEWKRWLMTHLPRDLRTIEIDGKWQYGSKMIIFTMPFEIWTFLADRPEYAFIDHVAGSNELVVTNAPQTSLSMRNKENIPLTERPLPRKE
ncbi:Hypothetical protein D9617_16g015040 [Elsinoe fawcettii]|nr:Hypothetical protein D9617_16g015040 [Elsinoe fawcettii]